MKTTITLIASLVLGCLAGATTKGLNQIVTPDIQPEGILSLSPQGQHAIIGNPYQLQLEYGLTRNFEVAAFDGFDPGQVFGAVEYGIVQQKDILLSAGFLNWSSRGDTPQLFLEGGVNRGNSRAMAGVQRSGGQYLLILGYGYQVSKDCLLQFDYLSGSQNFATAGFNYNITDNLQINPALYVANDSGHKLYPYVVLTWNVKIR